MQDIRKPYIRSRSNNDLQSRVEQFEAARYRRDEYTDEEPVTIPVKKQRRDIHGMDMYPRRHKDDEELFDDEDEEYQEEENYPSRQRRPTLRRKTPVGTISFIVAMVALVVGVSLYTYVFDSATITVVPKYKDVGEINKAFLFAKDSSNPSAISFVVESTSLSKTKTLTLSESRKVEAKASGKAVIYNNYDSSPQKLIKNTRFESTKGKIYRINQSVDVPGKSGNTPGSVEVTLYADSTGDDYNIDSTSFSIPGFKGTARETVFYAKTKGSISGGSSGVMALASLSDINAAKDSLALELDKSIRQEVQKIKKEGYTPMYSAVEVVYEDNEQDILKGASSVYKVTATGYLMLADSSKLAEAVAKTMGDYDNGSVRLTNIDTLKYTRKESDHVLATSTFSLLLEGSPRVVWETDTVALKELVKGQKRDDFKPLMKTINSIESAEIRFSPMWLSRFPSDTSKLIVVESLPKR